MILRRSSFIHQIPVGSNRILVVHAVNHTRLAVDLEVGKIIDYFAQPRSMPQACVEITRLVPDEEERISVLIKDLIERRLLTEKSPEEELAEISGQLAPTHGRDPIELLDHYRRKVKQGPESYWTVEQAYGVADLGTRNKRVHIALFGDCDVHMESDFLRREAARRGFDLRVAATTSNDFSFAAEYQHNAILVGALRSRRFIAADSSTGKEEPHRLYIKEAQAILRGLRENTAAPILIDNLPEPTVQPLGLAERGRRGHRTRFRMANVALAELAEEFSDVYVVDIAAALAAVGSVPLLDDGQVDFAHMGSPGWMLQRPDSEKTAVHGLFPDVSPLVQLLNGNPYARESVVSRIHIDTLVSVLGIGQKRCVILDLDGILWPGVLAETGAPFAWEPGISSIFSYVGLYFGLHQALLCLKQRGIILACVSKNDESTVRELWRYPDSYPKSRLLTLNDLATHRINWGDKVENIRSIAEELGYALDNFLFIDDSPIERERVRQRIPEVEVWGEDPFGLRRALLTDPRLQIARITQESAGRTDLVKAQLSRQRLRTEITSEDDYVSSLQIQTIIERQTTDAKLDRVEELFRRTTQFNATGKRFTVPSLRVLIEKPGVSLFTLNVSDRFGDHGLVGATVVEDGEIMNLVLSCRVLGLGIEHTFLQYILADLKKEYAEIKAYIKETPRNLPVRNLYRDHGFSLDEKGCWCLKMSQIAMSTT
jgi:FkbH-like protein